MGFLGAGILGALQTAAPYAAKGAGMMMGGNPSNIYDMQDLGNVAKNYAVKSFSPLGQSQPMAPGGGGAPVAPPGISTAPAATAGPNDYGPAGAQPSPVAAAPSYGPGLAPPNMKQWPPPQY